MRGGGSGNYFQVSAPKDVKYSKGQPPLEIILKIISRGAGAPGLGRGDTYSILITNLYLEYLPEIQISENRGLSRSLSTLQSVRRISRRVSKTSVGLRNQQGASNGEFAL